MIAGIDVSNYQQSIDWPAVARAGERFAWVLITDGNRFRNSLAGAQVAAARAAGLEVGGYHFARPNLHSADEEAAHFRSASPAGLTFPPALDLEAAWLASPAANTDWALRWFDVIDPPTRLVYTNGDGATRRLDSTRLARAGVELWYAHPTGAPGNFAGVGAWPTPAVVQWGVTPLAGIAGSVDRNAMTESTFDRYRGHQGATDMTDEEHVQLWNTRADLQTLHVKADQLIAKVDQLTVLVERLAQANAAGAPASLVGTAQIALHPA